MSFWQFPLADKLIKISQPLGKAEKRKIFIVFSLGVEGKGEVGLVELRSGQGASTIDAWDARKEESAKCEEMGGRDVACWDSLALTEREGEWERS